MASTVPAATTWPGRRRRWLFAAYAAFGVVIFVAFLIATFPYDDSISSILAPFKLKLIYQSQRISPPLGAKLEHVRLVSVANSPDQLLIESPDLTLAPTLGSLFLGRPGISVYADLFGGTAEAIMRQRSGVTALDFDLNGLSLSQSGLLRQLGATLSGKVSATGHAELRNPSIPDATGHFTLDGENVALQIVNGFPSLRLGTVTGTLTLDHGIITLDRLRAHGADLELNAAGTIQLAPDLPDSALAIHLSLKPAAIAINHFAIFLNLLPHPPASGPYLVQGRLAAPSIN